MKPLFISATGTGVGKSYTTQKLLQSLHQSGRKPLALKPIETGANPTPEDALLHLQLMQKLQLDQGLSLEEICLERYKLPASPWVSAKKEGRCVDVDRLLKRLLEFQKRSDPLLIEGAGGLLVPLLKEYFMIDLAEALEAHVVLVISGKLGGINEALLSLEALKHRQMSYTLVLNLWEEEKRSFEEISAPYWKERPERLFRLDSELEELTQTLLSAI
ncbi:MAG: dethiobiotin synthase [Wolinella succinogenes]|uniref:dethiobiotin synthase n=1 Tax=Wolinella succinogenes TaxID=844 RepID=UPI00169AA473|nr:dethiobiotin synthase [Wolinella succinogenes]NLU33970.1 dethiobiotin synthase [Wolinella succinogenes]